MRIDIVSIDMFKAKMPDNARCLMPALLILLTSASQGLAETPDELVYPDGYRLHYQGFCINIEDELSDTLGGEVRGSEPILSPPSDASGTEPIGYKFSHMRDGEFCKNAYVKLSKGLVLMPTAMALGDQSCGPSSVASKSMLAAKTEALKTCRAVTSNCRIIFPEVLD